MGARGRCGSFLCAHRRLPGQLELLQLSTPDAVCAVDAAKIPADVMRQFVTETLKVR